MSTDVHKTRETGWVTSMKSLNESDEAQEQLYHDLFTQKEGLGQNLFQMTAI